MKTHILQLSILLSLVLFYGCDKDDGDVSPSNADRNWYVIQDNPANPLDHLIYTVYQSSGIPIFYSDTIGQENRGTDAFGKPYIYYEVLDLSYSISAYVQQSFVLSTDQEDIQNGVRFLRDMVIPRLKEKMRPKCFLLVENLTDRETKEPTPMYKSLLTTAIGWISKLKTMSEAERTQLAVTIVGTEISSYLQSAYSDQIAKFYAISNKFISDDRTIYNVLIKETSSATVPYASWEVYGFLNPSPIKPIGLVPGSRYYTTPKEQQDLIDFIGQVIFTEKSDFLQKYAAYSVVIQKYNIIQEIIYDAMNR